MESGFDLAWESGEEFFCSLLATCGHVIKMLFDWCWLFIWLGLFYPFFFFLFLCHFFLKRDLMTMMATLMITEEAKEGVWIIEAEIYKIRTISMSGCDERWVAKVLDDLYLMSCLDVIDYLAAVSALFCSLLLFYVFLCVFVCLSVFVGLWFSFLHKYSM